MRCFDDREFFAVPNSLRFSWESDFDGYDID